MKNSILAAILAAFSFFFTVGCKTAKKAAATQPQPQPQLGVFFGKTNWAGGDFWLDTLPPQPQVDSAHIGWDTLTGKNIPSLKDGAWTFTSPCGEGFFFKKLGPDSLDLIIFERCSGDIYVSLDSMPASIYNPQWGFWSARGFLVPSGTPLPEGSTWWEPVRISAPILFKIE